MTKKSEAKTPKAEPVEPVLADTDKPKTSDEQIAELTSKLALQEEEKLDQQAQFDTLAALVKDLRTKLLTDEEETGVPVKRKAEVFADPYGPDQDGLAFKVRTETDEEGRKYFYTCDVVPPDETYKMGRKLGWKGMRLRNEIGMQGWVVAKLTDPFLCAEDGTPGGKLEDFLYAAPPRMEGSDNVDEHIRRGDVLLCWIDMKVWLARRRNREDKAMQRRSELHENDDKFIRRGVGLIGPGLQKGTTLPARDIPSHGVHRVGVPLHGYDPDRLAKQ